SRTPMTVNQPIRPASSSGLVAASPYLRRFADSCGKRPRITWAVAMSHPRSEAHNDGGQHGVDREERNNHEHHGFVHGRPQTLGATADRQTAIATDQSGDEPEDQSLDRCDDDF